ncbi:MAG: glycosyltransferase family 2 protein [Candidatus Aminicenantes bacterium]|jgi:GT2 family glycosyltransferase
MGTEVTPDLSVVMVNYNDRNHVKECLTSLKETVKDIPFEIVIIDNQSTDGTPEWIREHVPGVRLIVNAENVGFARANNQGIKESRGKYILFLNTDTVLEPQAVAFLLEKLRSSKKIGAAGPALLHGERGYQVSFGKKVSFFREVFQKLILNPFHRFRLKRGAKERRVGWLSAACLLTRKDVLEEVGPFDENFFLYFEDIDLCVRIRERGYELLYIPQARVYHLGGASTEGLKLFSRYHYRKSQIYFYEKHNSKASQALLRLYLRLNFNILLGWGHLRGAADLNERRVFKGLLRKN